jgi:putative membrane protein
VGRRTVGYEGGKGSTGEVMAMMWDGNDGAWGMSGGSGWLALVVIFTLVASAVAALVVTTGLRPRPPDPAAPSRLESPDTEADRILQRRFAAGEIDEDEYLRRRSLLHAG